MPRLVDPVLRPGALHALAQPVLPADGISLRPWRTEDAPALVGAYRDPAIQRWHMRVFDSEYEAAQWILETRQQWHAETDAQWAVVERGGEGALLGRVALRGVRLAAGWAEVSYWVLPAARGAGVASRAVERMARWALDDLGLHRLELVHVVDNAPSCRVADKTGFALEGTLRRSQRLIDGWHDTHLHARLRDDA